jgi:hypothetical protein
MTAEFWIQNAKAAPSRLTAGAGAIPVLMQLELLR